jgi:hypothetical protein
MGEIPPFSCKITQTEHALGAAAMNIHIGESFQGHNIQGVCCVFILSENKNISQKEKGLV